MLENGHPFILRSMNSLAQVLSNQAKYDETEKIHREALAVQERVMCKEPPGTLGSIFGLVHSLALRSNFIEADALYGRAITGCRKALGHNHPISIQCQRDYRSMLERMHSPNEPPRNSYKSGSDDLSGMVATCPRAFEDIPANRDGVDVESLM